jgi:hypothetical protein
MKLNPLFVAAIVLTPTPTFAAPPEVERQCFLAAERVTPILTQPEKEQYIANCIANWTAGTPPPPRGNTDRNSY